MCTAISMTNKGHYFGRNLDLETDYPVEVVITPRNHGFKMRHVPDLESNYAMIGTGMVADDYPLYFEAVNEKGLGMAGLAFFGYADYFPVKEGALNLTSFEILQYVLAKCASVQEARDALKGLNITNDSFAPSMPASEMHWIISDRNESIVIEQTEEKGTVIYDDPWGVMTNAPDFGYQKENLSYYANVTGDLATNRFAPNVQGMRMFSRGMGSIGLPGGTDSVSRFVRACFTKLNSRAPQDEDSNVSEFFHILGNVQQVSGETELKKDVYEITQYSSCINTETGTMYYTTYYNQSISAVNLFKENLDQKEMIVYPFQRKLAVQYQN